MASIDSKTLQMIVALMKPAPVAPVAPILQNYSNDHDLLTKLDTKVDNIQTDVSELKRDRNSYVTQSEHQELVRNVAVNDKQTKENTTNITKIQTWGTAAMIGVGIAETLLIHYWK